MAIELLTVLQNFIYHLEQITPTAEPTDQYFECINGFNTEDALSHLAARHFQVDLNTQGAPTPSSSSNGYTRESVVNYLVSIYYPFDPGTIPELLYTQVLSDLKQVIFTLENPSTRSGISGDPTLEMGLESRLVGASNVVRDTGGPYWALEINFNCLIEEEF